MIHIGALFYNNIYTQKATHCVWPCG